MEDFKKILVFRLGGLGDHAVALPVLNAIRDRYPQAAMGLLTNYPYNSQVIRNHNLYGDSGKFFTHHFQFVSSARRSGPIRALWYELRHFAPDLVVNLVPRRSIWAGLRDRIFLASIFPKAIWGAPIWFGREHVILEADKLWETETKRLVRHVSSKIAVETGNANAWSLRLDQDEVASALRGRSYDRPYIALCIGGKSDVQQWGMAAWRQTIASLAEYCSNYDLIAFGSAAESIPCAALLRLWQGHTENLCGQLTVRQSAAMLTGARMYLGQDSGPMQLAAAMGVPCVAVFCARSKPGIWFPQGPDPKSSKAIYHQTSCFGCERQVCEDFEKQCITSISPKEVISNVNQVLFNKK